MKKINKNALVKAIVFAMLGLSIIRIASNGDLALILHPKMFKFTYFAAFILMLSSVYMLFNLKKNSHQKLDYRILAFLLPIILMATNIERLKGQALKNMSYDVINNSKPNIIASGKLQTEENGNDKNDSNKDVVLPDQEGKSDFTDEKLGVQPDDSLVPLDKPDTSENLDASGNSELSDKPEVKVEEKTSPEEPIVKKVDEPKQESKPELDQDSKSDIDAKSEDAPKTQEPKSDSSDSNTLPPVSSLEPDENGMFKVPNNTEQGDEYTLLPSVSSTKGKAYDIDKFLNDILDAYDFKGDGTNRFDTQEYEIVGFVYRDDYFKENQFMVGRLLLTCCISDVSHTGLLIEGSGDLKSAYPDDAWVRVKGKLQWKKIYNPYVEQEMDVLTISPRVIERIEDIEYPYVYFE